MTSNGIIKINKGDVVTIVTNNRVITGEVLYAWIDANNGWHIGLVNTGTGLYTHWKQNICGGEVVKINGKTVIM